MADKEKKDSLTKVITGLLRFSYEHVWEAAAVGDDAEGDKKYSCCLLIRKDDKATLAKIEAAVKAATDIGIVKLWDGKKPPKLKLPLRDGDDPDETKGDEYKGCFFLNATSKSKPGVVDKDLNPILEKDQFYSGCWGRAAVNFYAFNVKGNKGIACGLNNVQKVKDGEALAGRSSAEDDFGSEPLDENDIPGGDDDSWMD